MLTRFTEPVLTLQGEAMTALDKTKVIVRLEARIVRDGATGKVTLADQKDERSSITDHILDAQGGK